VIVAALSGDCHGQLDVLPGQPVLAVADEGPSREHVVQRGQRVRAPGVQPDAEVLRVTVGCGHQPEGDLACEERAQVNARVLRAVQHLRQLLDAGAAICFVLDRRVHAARLAEVFLRKAKNPLRRRVGLAVESLDHQHRGMVRKGGDVCLGHVETQAHPSASGTATRCRPKCACLPACCPRARAGA
jgi:hypothetical protein